MAVKCPQCQSENCMEGFLTSYYGVRFCEKGTENKLRPNAYKCFCTACKDCGAVFDFKIQLKK